MTCDSDTTEQPRLPLPSPASVQSTVKWVGSLAFRPVLSTPGPNTLTFWGWLPWPIRTYTNSQGSELHISVTFKITAKSEHCLERSYRKTDANEWSQITQAAAVPRLQIWLSGSTLLLIYFQASWSTEYLPQYETSQIGNLQVFSAENHPKKYHVLGTPEQNLGVGMWPNSVWCGWGQTVQNVPTLATVDITRVQLNNISLEKPKHWEYEEHSLAAH